MIGVKPPVSIPVTHFRRWHCDNKLTPSTGALRSQFLAGDHPDVSPRSRAWKWRSRGGHRGGIIADKLMTANRATNIASAATVPSFIICGASPIFVPLFASLGLAGLGFVLHRGLWLLAPLNLLLLWRRFRRHRRPAGLLLAGAGTVLIWLHLLGHNFGRTILPLIWLGTAFLVAGATANYLAERRLRVSGFSPEQAQAYWNEVLTGRHPGLRRGRRFYRLLPTDPRCKLCNAPFRGPGGAIVRLIGKGRSPKNPNFCSDCLAKTPLGGAEVEVSMLFADVRGSTALAESMSPSEFASLLNGFYETATQALLAKDALVDRFVGDEVIGLFIPGYSGPRHAALAISAAKQLLHQVRAGTPPVPLGIGVHTGWTFVGMVGGESGVAELAALGDAMNTAARITAEASEGEILASEAACDAAGLRLDDYERRELRLKGKADPVAVRVIS